MPPINARFAVPTKEQTGLLVPFATLDLTQIIVPKSPQEFAAATADILTALAVGFDTESKPTFVKGESSQGPHTLQFALPTRAYIFQTLWPDCAASAVAILNSPKVLKVGFGLESDREQIQRKLSINMAAVQDLNTVFRQRGFARTTGVRAAVAISLNQKFHKSKRITTSNWAAPTLTSQQLLYAANDAYAALRVYLAVEQIPDQDPTQPTN